MCIQVPQRINHCDNAYHRIGTSSKRLLSIASGQSKNSIEDRRRTSEQIDKQEAASNFSGKDFPQGPMQKNDVAHIFGMTSPLSEFSWSDSKNTQVIVAACSGHGAALPIEVIKTRWRSQQIANQRKIFERKDPCWLGWSIWRGIAFNIRHKRQ